jgi:hypothetical protein
MDEQPDIPAQRPAKRRTKKEATNWASKSVALESDAHSTLDKAAKKLGLSNAKYASAAIRYFTQNGLDPTKAGVSELAQLRTQIGESAYEVRRQNADIGNRLVAIIRTWETNQYKFMQGQHAGIIGYLENIETNILKHQVAVESQVLAPLLERIVRNGIDAHMTRMLTEVLLLKSKDTKYSLEELKTSTSDYDAQRDRRLVSEVRKLLENSTVSEPIRTQKPALVNPVVGPAAKPAGTTGAPATVPTTPKV